MQIQTFLLLCGLTALSIACQPSANSDTVKQSPSATSSSNTKPAQGESVIKGGIVLQKQTDYSPAFVASLQNAKTDDLVTQLNGNQLTTQSGQTYSFPTAPPIGEELVFRGGTADRMVELRVERVNQSTLRYGIIIEQGERGNFEEKSLAELSPLFYLADETDEDDQSGLSYLSTEFSDLATECNNRIRIGQDEQGQYLAKLVMDCEDLDLSLEEGPTLRVGK